MLRRALRVVVALLALSGGNLALAAQDDSAPQPRRERPRLEVPPAAAGEAAKPSPIPRELLEQMYARELSGRVPPHSGALYDAHSLLEEYFAESSAKARQDVAAKLQATGVDPNLLGRIARLRMSWPELEPGVYYTNERHGPHDVRYFLGIPKGYDRTKSWPLLIKLPTANAFLTDPPPDADRVTQIYSQWIKSELTAHPDAIVLMPLLNLDELSGPSVPGMNTVIQPLLHAAERTNVDPMRVYMLGHSMAAHAVWNLSFHYPTYFAAINPLAGAATSDWQRLRLMNLSNVLPVVWHDATDEVIKVGFSRNIVKSLRGLNIDVDYEETKQAGHAPPPDVLERTYGKLRARSRELYPKSVSIQSNRPETIFNRNDWVQIYQPLNPGKHQRLLLGRGSGPMRLYQRSSSVQAMLAGGNRIELKTDNVAALRIYVNDQMIDFREPVTVIVNGKQRFAEKITPIIETMLKDQLFLGRGWRYYTAAIDLDLAPKSTTKPATKPTTAKAATRPAR